MGYLTQIKAQSLFKDKDERWAIWQWPNIPLSGWLACRLLSIVLKQPHVHAGLVQMSMAFLFTWAFLEITQGASYFRRQLGAVVIAGIIIGYLR